MALILPKGIVVNSPDLEGSIRRIASEPVDIADIANFWKVYTTTQRRLLDPTAERLENFWWRIWGSRAKKLKGVTVAQLFAQISDGQAFVPLRGPPNRDEGLPLNINTRHGPGASSTTAIHRSDSRPSTTSSSQASKSQAPMPHPILKKSRGPSTTGPRPTARFISPPESEGETDQSQQTSSVSPNTHVIVQPPSEPQSPIDPQTEKADKKGSLTVGKKKGGFLASTKKKRPVIVRRQTSHTSSSVEKTPPTFSQSRFQEDFSPASNQAPKKRISSRSSDSKRSPRKPAIAPSLDGSSEDLCEAPSTAGDPGPSTQLRREENLQDSAVLPDDLTEDDHQELEMQKLLLEQANTRLRKSTSRSSASAKADTKEDPRVLQGLLRSSSEGRIGPESQNALRLMVHESKSSASLAPTLAAATGQVNLRDSAFEQPQPSQRISSSSRRDKGKGREEENSTQGEMFSKRPVQPVQAATEPETTSTLSSTLSRSKSQLTLLLERDRARGGDHKPDGENSSGKRG